MFETTNQDPSFDCCPNPPSGTPNWNPQVEPPSGSHCSHETIGKESRLRIAHLQHEPFFGERVVEGTNASWATKGTNKNTGSPRFCLQVMGDSCRFSTSLDSSIHRGWKMATKPLIVVREAGPACPWHRGCSTKSRSQ